MKSEETTVEISPIIECRYQVFTPFLGQITTERTKQQAFKSAYYYLNHERFELEEIFVADQMARIGSINVWMLSGENLFEIGRKKK